jgi:hypothetical protein
MERVGQEMMSNSWWEPFIAGSETLPGERRPPRSIGGISVSPRESSLICEKIRNQAQLPLGHLLTSKFINRHHSLFDRINQSLRAMLKMKLTENIADMSLHCLFADK